MDLQSESPRESLCWAASPEMGQSPFPDNIEAEVAVTLQLATRGKISYAIHVYLVDMFKNY